MAIKVVQKEASPQELVTTEALFGLPAKTVGDLYFAKQELAVAKKTVASITERVGELESDVALAATKMGLGEESTLKVSFEEYTLDIGAEAKKRTIEDNKGLFDALEAIQPGLAYELMAFKLTDLDKYLSGIEQEKFVTTTHTGKRNFKVSLRKK